jgi:hypothetical protein
MNMAFYFSCVCSNGIGSDAVSNILEKRIALINLGLSKRGVGSFTQNNGESCIISISLGGSTLQT